MAVLKFSTTDTDRIAGRTAVLAALNAQATAAGLGNLFPADAATKTHVHLEIPGAALTARVPATGSTSMSA